GLLPWERPGRDGSNPGLGFLSVKNCRPAPGPPLWQVGHWVAGSLKILRPRSVAAVFGFGVFTKSVSEETKSAMGDRRMPTVMPVRGPRGLAVGAPTAPFTSGAA